MKDIKTKAPPADLGQLAATYTAYLDVSARSVGSYSGSLRQFVAWTSAQGIDRPTRADVIAYREELRRRCKPATVQSYITALRLFFRWTESEGIYPNIADHIKGARLDPGHKRDNLTADQVRRVLASIDTDSTIGKRDYSIIALMVTGGLRDIEISRANLDDLQTVSGRPALYVQGKGHEERTDYVFIVHEVESALRAYIEATRARHGNALFVRTSNNGNGERLSARSVSAIVKNRLRGAGLDSPRLTAHSLRHTAITLSLAGGVPLRDVQAFARHKSITTTQIYAHDLDRAKNASEATIAASIF